MEKRRLLFDLTSEEYQDFVNEAGELGINNISYLRKMWKAYNTLPPFYKPKANAGPTTKYRERYIGLALSLLSLLSNINANENKPIGFNTPEQEWEIQIKRLYEVIDRLAAVPVGTKNEGFDPPVAPEWFGLARAFENIEEKEDIEEGDE